MRSEFVATVTHELKTPIATIRAIGDSLASGRVIETGDQREYARARRAGSEAADAAGRQPAGVCRASPTSPMSTRSSRSGSTTLVETVAAAVPPAAPVRRVRNRRVEIPADLPPVRADRTAMTLLLDNLIDNAIRYSPANAVAADFRAPGRRGDRSCWRWPTTAAAFPADEIGQVTRKFVRGRHAGSGGSGLGLAIVKRIVADHGGRLAIHSVVDAGTTSASACRYLRTMTKKRILIVEDDAALARVLRDNLTFEGFEVQWRVRRQRRAARRPDVHARSGRPRPDAARA